jgi:hypothetical protein
MTGSMTDGLDGSLPRPDRPARHLAAAVVNAAPLLTATAVGMALLILPTLAALVVDPRLHQGIPIWIKPLKFEIALAIYAGTLAVFAMAIPPRVRAARWFRVCTAAAVVAMVYEIVWIGGAAAAGIGSHFNVGTTLMSALYSLAGIGAVTLTALSLVFGIVIARHRPDGMPPPLHLSLWLGLVMTFGLTLVTAGTMASMPNHFVGGDGLDTQAWPLLGWARDGGDLRVAHFFATHALHALPVLGLIASRSASGPAGRAWVVAGALGYAAFVGYTFAEALAGYPFPTLVTARLG